MKWELRVNSIHFILESETLNPKTLNPESTPEGDIPFLQGAQPAQTVGARSSLVRVRRPAEDWVAAKELKVSYHNLGM